jgi:hypothetical protein
MLQDISKHFQRLGVTSGGWTRHARDMAGGMLAAGRIGALLFVVFSNRSKCLYI